MMRSAQSVLAAVMLISGGCATRGNVELLESQLREQEDALYAAQAERDQAKAELRIAQQEAQALRVQLTQQGKEPLLPEQARTLYRVAGVKVNEWFSGGLDRDNQPGDDQLNVVLIPHDEHGETVKLPGRVELEAIDLSAPESSRRLGLWEFDSEQVAESWHSGLTSGFQFRLPLTRPPASAKIVVRAQFDTLDGRQFQTTADLRVTPADIQYASGTPANVPMLRRTSVKPISAPAPQLGVVEGREEGEGKPTVQESQTVPGDRETQEFFPVGLPTEKSPAIESQDKTSTEFFPRSATTPPAPAPPAAPAESEWGWKSLDSVEEIPSAKQQPSDLMDDFQSVPDLPTSDSLKSNDKPKPNRTAGKALWTDLPSSDVGERKPQ